MSTLQAITKESNDIASKPVTNSRPVDLDVNNSSDLLYQQVKDESEAMAKYALSNGLDVDATLIQHLCESNFNSKLDHSNLNDINQLTCVHQSLAKVVNPATPRAINLLDKEQNKKSYFYFLGPVPLVRRLSGIAVLFLTILITVSLSSEVNVTNINKGLLTLASMNLFLNQLFLLCCAGLGAIFSALFQVNRYVARATYDPRYDATYWTRIILGLIAGLILVELLPPDIFKEGSNMHSFGKPTLAMFGGFSATVVYRIIERLVESLETLVKGQTNATEEQQSILRAQASESKTQISAEVASKLVQLQNDIINGGDEDARSKISSLVQQLLPNKQ